MHMRTKSILLTTAVIGLAVVAGLLGVGGTWALWNSSVQSTAGTVQAANFDIRLNGAPMGATATAVPEVPGALLKPGTPVYAIVKIDNASNAGTPMSVAAVMEPPKVVNPSVPGLGTKLRVHAGVQPSGGCADADYRDSGTSVSTTIDQGKADRFCLRMTLPANVSPSLINETATITTTVTVIQQSKGL
jgi:predicted ribosomally synthesized peptide with SipW-like signal peptide